MVVYYDMVNMVNMVNKNMNIEANFSEIVSKKSINLTIDNELSSDTHTKKAKLEKKLLHYTSKAIADFGMINHGDRVMVCLSGGKDSHTMLSMLRLYNLKAKKKFEIFVFVLDQSQPGWDDSKLRAYLDNIQVPYEILTRDTYSIVKKKIQAGKTYCSLCSRLRRGNMYHYAEQRGFNKIALGHHRDDLIQTLLMSILYNGEIRSMPPKLLTDNKKLIVIRPLAYCQQADIMAYAVLQQYPIIPCNLCGSQENLARKRIARLIFELAKENPKIPSNILHAIGSVSPSQLMDHKLWNFKELKNLTN